MRTYNSIDFKILIFYIHIDYVLAILVMPQRITVKICYRFFLCKENVYCACAGSLSLVLFFFLILCRFTYLFIANKK